MNNAHLHLIFNHLPLTFVILGLIIMVFGFIFKSEIVKRIAYLVFIIASIFGFVTFSSGEGTKEILEGSKLIDGRFVTVHEEIALAFLVLLYILSILSLIGLWASWKKKPYSKIISVLTILFLIVVFYYAIKAGASGGEIQHKEIRTLSVNSNSVELSAKNGVNL